MIVDVVPFNNELDLLELRLNVLAPVVDTFVISESRLSFTGREKPLFYQDNRVRFADFADRIVHHVVQDAPAANPFERDRQQKDDIRRVLDKICQGEDLILSSDVDEIPNPDQLPAAIDVAEAGKLAVFAQRLFYYYVNLEETSGRLLSISGEFPGIRRKRWLGSRMARMSHLSAWSVTEWRDPARLATAQRVAEGGWHFSYAGSPDPSLTVDDRIRLKVRDTAHQELVNERMERKLTRRVASSKDIFGRRARFTRVEIDQSFPQYLIDHRDRYAHMILP